MTISTGFTLPPARVSEDSLRQAACRVVGLKFR
jgi:hypothetical protein